MKNNSNNKIYGKQATKGFNGLFNSFKFAFLGIIHCITHERNMRIHIVSTIYVMIFSLFYNFSTIEYSILIIICGMVIFAEMINTSIEAVCDANCKEYSEKIKIAKDVAAGAVSIFSFVAAIIGLIMFFDLNIIKSIIEYFKNNTISILILFFSFYLSYLFIKSKE